MQFVWQPKDIISGRKYTRPDIDEVWTIGYLSYADTDKVMVSVSSKDGMVTVPCTREYMAHCLTMARYIPVEFIPHIPKETLE